MNLKTLKKQKRFFEKFNAVVKKLGRFTNEKYFMKFSKLPNFYAPA